MESTTNSNTSDTTDTTADTKIAIFSHLHVSFLKDLLKRGESSSSLEFIFMSHLKTSVIYWSLTAAVLLEARDEIFPPEEQVRVWKFLENVYKADGGFAGNEGAHDSHILFTLSAIQIMKILCEDIQRFPDWFSVDRTVECKKDMQFVY
jgi:geranylgeranyl transferase type-2 subunit beta